MQTSACGTPLWVPQALGVGDSVLQVHDRLTVRRRAAPSPTTSPPCPSAPSTTSVFCQGLLEQTRARFLRATVTGVADGAVLTSDGRFTAPVIVDCSGWRGALVHDGAPDAPRRGIPSGSRPRRSSPTRVSRSGSTEADSTRARLDFPRRQGEPDRARLLRGAVQAQAGARALSPRSRLAPAYHGTYFPNRLFRPTVGRLFAVGDAAGQCLPLTAEGIRPAFYFGVECGRIIQQIFEGRLGLDNGTRTYRRLVDRTGARTDLMAQWVAEHAPTGWFVALTGLAGRRPDPAALVAALRLVRPLRSRLGAA